MVIIFCVLLYRDLTIRIVTAYNILTWHSKFKIVDKSSVCVPKDRLLISLIADELNEFVIVNCFIEKHFNNGIVDFLLSLISCFCIVN